jgi:hypothetical protein
MPPQRDTLNPQKLSKANLSLYYPSWALIYPDIDTLAKGLMLSQPSLIWNHHVSLGHCYLSDEVLITHPLYKIASSTCDYRLRTLTTKLPDSSGQSTTLLNLITKSDRWYR